MRDHIAGFVNHGTLVRAAIPDAARFQLRYAFLQWRGGLCNLLENPLAKRLQKYSLIFGCHHFLRTCVDAAVPKLENYLNNSPQ